MVIFNPLNPGFPSESSCIPEWPEFRPQDDVPYTLGSPALSGVYPGFPEHFWGEFWTLFFLKTIKLTFFFKIFFLPYAMIFQLHVLYTILYKECRIIFGFILKLLRLGSKCGAFWTKLRSILTINGYNFLSFAPIALIFLPIDAEINYTLDKMSVGCPGIIVDHYFVLFLQKVGKLGNTENLLNILNFSNLSCEKNRWSMPLIFGDYLEYYDRQITSLQY